MSAEMRSENEVFKTIRDCIIDGLTTFGIENGVDVRRFAQANFNHGDKLVLMNFVKTSRAGFQATRYRNATIGGETKFTRRDEWIEEQTYQISCIKKMQKDDTVETITAEDIATSLITWFNGRGLDWLRERNLSCYPIDPNSIIVYNDDSDLYQRRPVFNVTFIVNKSFKLAQDHADILGVETKPI